MGTWSPITHLVSRVFNGPSRRRAFPWPTGLPALILLLLGLTFSISPWPGVLLIRETFEGGTSALQVGMVDYAPDGIATIADEPYRPGDKDARLDVYFPAGAEAEDEPLPAIVWIHGGAWISGTKEDAAPYFKIIASHGYSVVSLEYSLGPANRYPTPVRQINDALAYLQTHAARFHINPAAIFLAGDSAGAQLASQIATLATNPAYAASTGIMPSLQPEQLRGAILFCGIFDMQAFVEADGVLGWGNRTSAWAYTGSRNTADNRARREMSTINHVTEAFPPVFITGGNADPLTAAHSIPFAARAEDLGVKTTALFYPEDHEPPLGHEYQFNLDSAEGRQALSQMLRFIEENMTARP